MKPVPIDALATVFPTTPLLFAALAGCNPSGLVSNETNGATGGTGGQPVVDECPADPAKTQPGFCGCGIAEGDCCDDIDSGFVQRLGAEYAFYGIPYSQDLDLDSLTPADTQIVRIIKDQVIQPAASGDSFVVLSGFIDISQPGTYEFSPGYGDSTYNVMTVNDFEVHRRNVGDALDDRVVTEIYLESGFHRFEIVFFRTINPLAIWMNGGRMNDKHLWHLVPFGTDEANAVVNALAALKGHVEGTAVLADDQIAAHHATIERDSAALGHSGVAMTAAHDLVASYDAQIGPLWIADATKGGFNRTGLAITIHTTIYLVMQTMMDTVYKTPIVGRCSKRLQGRRFLSADYFPGRVDSAPDPGHTHTVEIDASQPEIWGHEVMYAKDPARRPTGTYLPPGTVATVIVPEALVGNGFTVRVGAHSWDLSNRPRIKRLDRLSLVFDIVNRQTHIASPLGGGIYIEVPYLANAGVVEVAVDNAVRAPFFSAKPFHTTSLAEWQNTERHHGAPWADFQSTKFMMNVPTSWIYALDDPATLMQDWDASTDAMNDLMGFPHTSGKETMYPQVDVIMRASVHAPGYPSVNATYDPNRDYGGLASSHLVSGPQIAPSYEFHEKGHGYLFVKYGGEQESTVNLLHVAVWHQKLGYSLDEAFRMSCGFSNEHRTLKNTAVAWMTSFNFSPRNLPMAPGEKAYQIKGHAKFVEIARLFGWEALNGFWRSINEDYENGIVWSKHGSPIDDITLRLSEKAGVDLTPLLHFWGVHPQDPDDLKQRIAAAQLPASAKIYDALVEYKSVVPADNADFQDFAFKWWGKQPSVDGYWTETEHARQWDSQEHLDRWDPPIRANGEIYDDSAAVEVRRTVQDVIDLYFPGGRPG